MPTVTTNTGANTALRFLNINDMNTRSSIGKLSSGSRIVKASDDASSLAISTNLNADVVVLRQASTNAANGTAVVQVADGGLARIADILSRMKALATQSLSGSVDATSRGYINAEFTQIRDEITSIAEQTEFNGTELLDTAATLSFMVGRAAADTIDVATVVVTATGLAVNASVVDTATNATTALTAITTAINTVNSTRANMGSYMSRFDFRARNVDTQIENIEAAKSSLLDTDVAAEMTKFTSAQVLMQANVAMLAQANQLPQNLLRLLS
ncbi:MAG: flagellin [Inquilinus sp.]|nr:flagellin [Inquilinus sp.]